MEIGGTQWGIFSGPSSGAPGELGPNFQYTTFWKNCQVKYCTNFQKNFFPNCAFCRKL